MLRRTVPFVASVAIAIGLSTPALAHVTVNPSKAPKGSFTKLAFRFPNESETASTTKVEITFPDDAPISFVTVRPVPGWTVNVEKAKLDEPIEGESGEITEAVSKVTWEGGEIDAGEFQEFEVSAGPLPTNKSELVFKAVQTYSDGEVSRWIEEAAPGGEEPEKPAPVLSLMAASDDDPHGDASTRSEDSDDKETKTSTDAEDDVSEMLSIAALVVGGLALLIGGAAFLKKR